jgi:hypothetical protein
MKRLTFQISLALNVITLLIATYWLSSNIGPLPPHVAAKATAEREAELTYLSGLEASTGLKFTPQERHTLRRLGRELASEYAVPKALCPNLYVKDMSHVRN